MARSEGAREIPASRGRLVASAAEPTRPGGAGPAVAALALLFLIGLSACRSEPPPQPQALPARPNILLITIDTLRADHLGCYGYEAGSTPMLDELAARGVRFRQAYTPVPVTLPSHASLMTATYPRVHGAQSNGASRLSPDAVTLAERLHDEGWRTAAFIAADVLARQYGLDQGFEVYRDDSQGRMTGTPDGRRAGEVTDLVLDHLQGREEPWFVWAHYWDPHTPYDPPPPFDQRFSHNPYDGEIAYMDQEVGRLLRWIDDSGRAGRTLVALVADHGEGLDEHGEPEHGVFLYETTLHIPMLLAGPGIPVGTVVETPVRTIDLAPTLLDLVRLPIGPASQGQSLKPLFLRQSMPVEPIDIFMESEFGKIHYGWSPLTAIRVGDWKYIHAPIPELFHLGDDPRETENLAASRTDVRDGLQAQLEHLLGEMPARIEGLDSPHESMDAEQRRRLAALGYLSGAAVGRAPGGPAGPDPKTRLPIMKKVAEITRAFQKGQSEAAVEQLRALLVDHPDSTFAAVALADELAAAGRHGEASDVLARLVAAVPGDAQARLYLGISLLFEQRVVEAREQFLAALRIFPDMAQAEEKLGIVLAMTGDLAGARTRLERAVTLAPSLPEAQENLGLLLLQLGEESAAEERFRRAIELRPVNPTARQRLADLLRRQGRTDEARSILPTTPSGG